MSKLSVHLRIFKGESLSYDANGKSVNENHIVVLQHDTTEYKRFLALILSNGIIKATVEKVLDLEKTNSGKQKSDVDYYQSCEEDIVKGIQAEVDAAISPTGVIKLTPDQERIAKLEADIEMLKGGNKAKEITIKGSEEVKTKVELTDDQKAELKIARDKYVELYGKKGHPGWSVEELNVKISEFKA